MWEYRFWFTPFLFTSTFFKTQLGRKIRAWCIWFLPVILRPALRVHSQLPLLYNVSCRRWLEITYFKNFYPKIGHEGPEVETRYSTTLSSTSALDGGGWSTSRPPPTLYPRGRDPLSIIQEAGWAPGPVWTGTEKFPPHWDSILREYIFHNAITCRFEVGDNAFL